MRKRTENELDFLWQSLVTILTSMYLLRQNGRKRVEKYIYVCVFCDIQNNMVYLDEKKN